MKKPKPAAKPAAPKAGAAFAFPVEFWVWALSQFQNQPPTSPAFLDKATAVRNAPHMHLSNGYRLVRLVPADPAAAAVVRAAVKWVGLLSKSRSPVERMALSRLIDAVEAIEAIEKIQRKGRR